jgi:putative membrane protein
MKRLLAFILLLCVAALGLGFTTLNAHVVTLHYYYGSTTLPLALIVVATLGAGAILGMGAALGLVVAKRTELAVLRRRVALCEKEINNLRQIPIKDER